MRTALTIAGSDCSGGAGIQADLKTFSAHGVYGMSVITSVVAENTMRVLSIHDVDLQVIRDQIQCVFEDIPPDAVKIGMLHSPALMELVKEELDRWKVNNVVLDPVMVAKGGQHLMEPEAEETLKKLLPYCTVLTPNIPEAEVLLGEKIETVDAMKEAAIKLHRMGAKTVLVKGGHRVGDATDVFYDGEITVLKGKRIDTKNTHGTGCTLSSAIAANLAKGRSPLESVRRAKEYITGAITHDLHLGKGHGPTNHFYRWRDDFEKL